MTVTVSPVNSGPLPVRAAGNAEQQQALGHAEVGGDGVGRRLGAPSVPVSQQVRQPRDVHRPRQQGETGPMRLATVIACTLWVTMVGIMPGFAEKRVAGRSPWSLPNRWAYGRQFQTQPAPRSKRIISVLVSVSPSLSLEMLTMPSAWAFQSVAVAPPSLKKRADAPHAIALLRLRLNRPAGARSIARGNLAVP